MPGDPLGPSAADDDDLRRSLIRLSQLATSTLTLPETLIQVACLARLAIPASDGVGLNLAQSRGSDSSAATSEPSKTSVLSNTASRRGRRSQPSPRPERCVIDHSIGILISRSGCTANEAS